MQEPRKIYKSRDLAIIIPTKDRPEKLKNLLTSLSQQAEQCGQIIVVDGGKSVKEIVRSFSDRLSVEHYECHPPGQIRQRNMGISKLDTAVPLVGFIDDDLVLEPDALRNMIEFWNRVEENTAGVGFNILNVPPHDHSKFWGLLLMSSPLYGHVLPSGYNSPIHNIPLAIKTQWLGGGYTIWKHEILKKFPQDEIKTPWAIGEDLRFSYPIGKQYPLYVCATAKARHEHVYDQYAQKNIERQISRKAALASFYFVGQHRELSRLACLWMLVGSTLVQFIYGCMKFKTKLISSAFGKTEAIWIYLKTVLGFSDLLTKLED